MSTSLARLAYFYVAHAILFLVASLFYLFFFQPQLLDKSTFASAVVLVVWTIYNSPISSRIVGHQSVAGYRSWCLRHFRFFRNLSVVVLLVFSLVSHSMLRDLWHRWTYVEMIKRLTLDETGESIPFPSAEELATAFILYPHRREVPFILGKMSSILAFDDQTSNYNLFVSKFLEKMDVKKIAKRYSDKSTLATYEGAMDPLAYLARVIVNAGNADLASLRKAVALLDTYRKDDAIARMYRLIFMHEIYEQEAVGGPATPIEAQRRKNFVSLLQEMTELLDSITSQTATKDYIRTVTANAFQELLDHCAQLYIEVGSDNHEARIRKVVELYSRILTMRELIASASEVPWFEGPGKFTVFQYFKHQVGRKTSVTRKIMSFYDNLPGLKEALKQELFEAEAFKEFRSLDTWYRGTSLSASFTGKGMHNKMTEWLKSGW